MRLPNSMQRFRRKQRGRRIIKDEEIKSSAFSPLTLCFCAKKESVDEFENHLNAYLNEGYEVPPISSNQLELRRKIYTRGKQSYRPSKTVESEAFSRYDEKDIEDGGIDSFSPSTLSLEEGDLAVNDYVKNDQINELAFINYRKKSSPVASFMRIFKEENHSMESSLLSVEKEFVIQEYDSKYEIPLDKDISITSTASIVGDREPLTENFTEVDEQNLKSTITDFLCEIFEKAAEKANHIWRMTQLEGYVPMIGTRTPLLENISVSPKTNELFAEVTKRNKQEYHLHMEIKDRYKDLSVIKGIREKEPIKEIWEKQPIKKRPIFDGYIFETKDL